MIKTCRSYPHKKTFCGFTLIEILIAVAIVSTLMGLTLLVINPSALRKKVRDAQRKKDLEIISLALEQYYADNNDYPDTDFSGLTGALSGGSTVYIKTVPADPGSPPSTTAYSYCYSSQSFQQNQNYVMCAIQEASTLDKSAPDSNLSACDTTPVAQNDNTIGRHCVTNPL